MVASSIDDATIVNYYIIYINRSKCLLKDFKLFLRILTEESKIVRQFE